MRGLFMRRFLQQLASVWQIVVAAWLACSVAGCGTPYYPVSGTITLNDGSPLTRGLVIFERVDDGPPVTARGEIQADGRFSLSTDEPGDGVPAGRYKAVINPL